MKSMKSHEMLQRRRFCNVAQRFHRNYMAASEQRWIVTSQQRCNDVFVSTGVHLHNVGQRRNDLANMTI